MHNSNSQEITASRETENEQEYAKTASITRQLLNRRPNTVCGLGLGFALYSDLMCQSSTERMGRTNLAGATTYSILAKLMNGCRRTKIALTHLRQR